MITNAVKRGDIVLCDLGSKTGSVQKGLRPVLVLQHNQYNESSPTTIIAPISSVKKKPRLFAHIDLGKNYGLDNRSMVLLEQLRVIDQENVGELIGHINLQDETMKQIDRGLVKLLDVKNVQEDSVLRLRVSTCKTRKKPKKPRYDPRDIMCLCPVCRDSYRHRGFRVINVGGPKDICDLCNYRTGVDYAVVGLLSR